MVNNFDPAAFLAALQAAAAPSLKSIELPGVGACFKRPLTAGDVLDADDVRTELKAAGVAIDRKTNVAIGLAQVLCGPDGERILNPADPAHIAMLKAVPWSAVRGLMGDDAEPDEKND